MRNRFACALALALFAVLPEAAAGDPSDRAPIRPETPALRGLDGRQHELREWRGKVVLLNFWASWCSPCQTEIRDLASFQAEYGRRGFQIVGIGLDDEARLRNVQRTLGINYPVLLAGPAGNSLMLRYGNGNGVVPYSVLISRTGEIVYAHAGTIDQEIFGERVLPLLGAPVPRGCAGGDSGPSPLEFSPGTDPENTGC